MQTKKRGRKKTPFELGLGSYLRLVIRSIFKPTFGSRDLLERASLLTATSYLFINSFIGLFCLIVLTSLKSARLNNFFTGVSQLVIFLPIIIVTAACWAMGNFLLARILGGKASLVNSLKSLFLSTGGLTIAWIPYALPISLASFFFCLLLNSFFINEPVADLTLPRPKKSRHPFTPLKNIILVAIPFALAILFKLVLFGF